MRAVVLFLLAASAVAVRLDEAQNMNPIRRIVTLLQKMQAKCEEEKRRDEALHTKFVCYCKKGGKAVSGEINDQTRAAQEHEKDAKTKFARVAQLKGEVKEAKHSREDAKATIEKANAMRKKESEEYAKASGEMGKNIKALSTAIVVLKKNLGKSFLQNRANVESLKSAVAAAAESPESEKNTVMSFIASPYGDYQAASGEIVGILEEMKSNMEKDLGTTVDAEKEAAKNHAELVDAKEAEVKAATKAIEEKSVRYGQLQVEAVEAKNSAANERKAAGENSEFAANLINNCKTKDEEYAERGEKRNKEIVAISQAIHILNGDDALDIFKKTLTSPGAPATSLLQTQDSMRHDKLTKAFAMVQGLAAVSPRSGRFSLIAYMLKVGKVDFSKVVKMIDEMISHLISEQKSDDDHLTFCNKNLDSEGDAKKEQERKIKDLTASIDEFKERIESLTSEMKVIKKDMEDTTASAKEATEHRQEENDEFKKNMVELNAAKQLLAKAANRLNKFYNPAAYKPPPQRELSDEERIAQNMGEKIPTTAPEMIAGTNQAVNFLAAPMDIGPAPDAGVTYKKQTAKSGGVTALMNMLTKELDMQIQEAQHDEKIAQRDYETTMSDSKKSLTDSQKELTQKEGEHAECRENLDNDTGDRGATNKELEATNEKIGALHKSCDFLMQNFDFRKEARAREIVGMKNAKAVLAGADYGDK